MFPMPFFPLENFFLLINKSQLFSHNTTGRRSNVIRAPWCVVWMSLPSLFRWNRVRGDGGRCVVLHVITGQLEPGVSHDCGTMQTQQPGIWRETLHSRRTRHGWELGSCRKVITSWHAIKKHDFIISVDRVLISPLTASDIQQNCSIRKVSTIT